MLYEIEFASVYRMTVAHDVYSGLGAEAGRAAAASQQDSTLQPIAEVVEKEEDVSEEVEGALSPTKTTTEKDMSEEELAKELRRAENIVEAFRDVKVR